MAASKIHLDLIIHIKNHWAITGKVLSRQGDSRGKVAQSDVGKSNFVYAEGVLIKVEKLDCECAAAMRCVAIFSTEADVHLNVFMQKGLEVKETNKGTAKLTLDEVIKYGAGSLVPGDEGGEGATEYHVVVVGTAGNKPVCKKCDRVVLPRGQEVILPYENKVQELGMFFTKCIKNAI